jgi:serine/threonine-protein kinase
MATSSKQRVLRSGVIIAEKYRVDEAIARGGFSVIYRGTHIEMQRPVALKLLTIDDEIKASWLERFTREARLASQLTHPNTVTIFDYGQDERGFLYIVMEWVDGVSLYQHLKSHGSLPASDVASITAQILLSLDEAHRRGFLHRDLKPSNIMLSHDYEGQDMVKVLDFGIAKHLEGARGSGARDAARITHQGAFIGTPRYASPEQLDGKALTPAADIYSLGLLMWEALVGDPAVPSVEYGDCVKKHLGSEPWRLPDSVQCPPGLSVILYKALEKSIDQRYQSCREMHRELAAWLKSSEALRESEQEFFMGASAAAGFEPSGLGADSSSVDEDELFAGLTEESDSQDEPPLDLHGPSHGKDSYNEPRQSSPTPSDDTFERELMALANASASQTKSGRAQSEEPSTPRQPASPRPASTVSAQPGSSSNSQKTMTIVMAAVAALLVLGAGAYALLSGGEPEPEAPSGSEQAAGSEQAHATQESNPKQDEASLDDGTPTYKAGLIWRAISESSWRRIGQVDTLDFSDVIQSSARFRKQAMTVTVTVYETDSHLGAEQYVETTKEPMQAIRFGKTAVQVSPGAKGNSTRGVYDLMSSLFQLKAIARQQVEEKGE